MTSNSVGKFFNDNSTTLITGAVVLTAATVGLMIYDRTSTTGINGRKRLCLFNNKDVKVIVKTDKGVLSVRAIGKTEEGKRNEKEIQRVFVNQLKMAGKKLKLKPGKARAKVVGAKATKTPARKAA